MPTMGTVLFQDGQLVIPTLPSDPTILNNINNFTDIFLPANPSPGSDSSVGCGATENSATTCCNIRTELHNALQLANCTKESRIIHELLSRNASVLMNNIPNVLKKGLQFLCIAAANSNSNNPCMNTALKVVQKYQNRPVTQRGCADASLLIADVQYLCTKDPSTNEYCLSTLNALPTGLSDVRTRGWSSSNDISTSSSSLSLSSMCSSPCVNNYRTKYTMINAMQSAAIANITDATNPMNSMDNSMKQQVIMQASNRAGQVSAMLESINTHCRRDPATNQLCAVQTPAAAVGVAGPMDTMTTMLSGTATTGNSNRLLQSTNANTNNMGGGMAGSMTSMSALRPHLFSSDVMCTYCGRSSLLGQAQVTLARLQTSGQHELRQVCDMIPTATSSNSQTKMAMMADSSNYVNCTIVNATAEALQIQNQVDTIISAGACGKDGAGTFCVDHVKKLFAPLVAMGGSMGGSSGTSSGMSSGAMPMTPNNNRLRQLQNSPNLNLAELGTLGFDVTSPLAKHLIAIIIGGCGNFMDTYATDNTAKCPNLCSKALQNMRNELGCCSSFLLRTAFRLLGPALAPNLNEEQIGTALGICGGQNLLTTCTAQTPRAVVTRVGGLNFHYVNASKQRREAFKQAYIRDIAKAVAEPESSFTITDLTPGSVIVSMSVSGSSDSAVTNTVQSLSTVTSSSSFQLSSVSELIAADPANALTDGTNLTLNNMATSVSDSMSNSLISGGNSPSNSAFSTVAYSMTLIIVMLISTIMTVM